MSSYPTRNHPRIARKRGCSGACVSVSALRRNARSNKRVTRSLARILLSAVERTLPASGVLAEGKFLGLVSGLSAETSKSGGSEGNPNHPLTASTNEIVFTEQPLFAIRPFQSRRNLRLLPLHIVNLAHCSFLPAGRISGSVYRLGLVRRTGGEGESLALPPRQNRLSSHPQTFFSAQVFRTFAQCLGEPPNE